MLDVRKLSVMRYNHRLLADDGAYVSREFKGFQTSFVNGMKKVAASLGGKLVKYSKGHYDVSGFIKVGESYVYFSYDNGLSGKGRSYVDLTGDGSWVSAMLVRTVKDENDYTGGRNVFTTFVECERTIAGLLK